MTVMKKNNFGTGRIVCNAVDAHVALELRKNVPPKQTQSVWNAGLVTIILTLPGLKDASCKFVLTSVEKKN